MPQSDSHFGKYELLERIAAGGMAEIYRARFTAAAGITKDVVIKKILPHYAGSKAFISMFINEAKIAVRLSHGNIAQVFDFGEIDGEYFLAMEYVHGQPLSKLMKRAKTLELPGMPVSFAALVGLELCKGLHYAHTRLDDEGKPLNIIHRDVSPQNVIISYEGQVKIVDFGIAKARTATESETATGAVKGKYVYFAPEQARGKELDSRIDIFAAGTVLFELLTGRLPFEGKMVEVLTKIANGDVPPIRSVNPEIPAELEKILLTAMAVEAKDRYQTAEAFQTALSTFLYTSAPSFSAGSLSHLMQYLFEPELVAEGRPVQLPREFLEQVGRWRKLPPPTDTGSMPRLTLTEENPLPGGPESTRTEQAQVSKVKHRLGFWAAVALLVATGLTAVTVVAVRRLGTFSVRLESSPSGATVTLDGQVSGNVTPQLISNLAATRPHRLAISAPGMKPWARELSAERGTVVPVFAQLEPEAPPPEPPPPPVASPAPKPADEVPMGAEFPARAIRLDPKKHLLIVPPTAAAHAALDAAKVYRVWTEGRLTSGKAKDRALTDQALFFLDGPVAAGDSFGVVGPKPRLVKDASALYAFRLDASASDFKGALKVRVQERGAATGTSLKVDPREAVALDAAQRFTLSNLDSSKTYEFQLADGDDPARTRSGPSGQVGRAVCVLSAGSTVLDGKRWVREAQRVFEVGKPYRVRGALWAYFTFLDAAADDNGGALDLRVAEVPGLGPAAQSPRLRR